MRRIIAIFLVTALIGCSGNDRSANQSAADTSGVAPAGVSAARDSSTVPVTKARNVVFLGTSLTAGLGVGAEAAFPAVIQKKIDDAHLPFRVTNAGISGETSAGGVRRIDWLLQTPVDVLVLELGANDGLRALNVDSLEHNLEIVLQKTRAKYPYAALIVVGMDAPPNLGKSYTSRFHAVYPRVAKEFHAELVPFLLKGVAGDRALNQDDGMHPNETGHRLLADNVWAVLQPVLIQRSKAGS